VLNGAVAKHLVITGDKKRRAVERARHMRPEEAPVAAVLDDMTVHWAP
jgi:6-phosphogluconolactonase